MSSASRFAGSPATKPQPQTDRTGDTHYEAPNPNRRFSTLLKLPVNRIIVGPYGRAREARLRANRFSYRTDVRAQVGQYSVATGLFTSDVNGCFVEIRRVK